MDKETLTKGVFLMSNLSILVDIFLPRYTK